MTAANTLVRTLITYAVILPVAILLGYSAGYGMDKQLAVVIGFILTVLATPVLLKWYHPLLFLTWNMSAVAFFLPGSPELWLVMAYGGLLIVIVEKALIREKELLPSNSVLIPILFLAFVVLVTAQVTGGFGTRAFGGSTFGGRRYIVIFAAAAAFIAMASRPVPTNLAALYVTLFFLGGLTNAVGSLIPTLPRPLWVLASLFPVTTNDLGDMVSESTFHSGGIARYYGLTVACQAGLCFLLAMHGVRNSLDRGKVLRLALLLGVVTLGAMGGFRSYLLFAGLLTFFVAYFEGVFRSRLLLPVLLISALGVAAVLAFSDKLPLSIQRSISVLPVRVSPVAEYEAKSSSEWRVNMWKLVWPEVPKYFWLGKGLSVQGRDLETETMLAKQKGASYDTQLLTGDYHNGPLTLLIPFGIWGALAWIWFLIAAIRALYQNHKYATAAMQTMNTFLLSLFVTKCVVFFVVFGNFWSDVPQFVGIVGLSVALNGGILSPVKEPSHKPHPELIPIRVRPT